jgi:hypothetical protein
VPDAIHHAELFRAEKASSVSHALACQAQATPLQFPEEDIELDCLGLEQGLHMRQAATLHDRHCKVAETERGNSLRFLVLPFTAEAV